MRLPAQPDRGGRLQFDVWGTVFFAGFIAPVLLAMERAQRFDPRDVPAIAVLLALAGVSLVLLLRQERRAPAPLLPIQLLRQAGIWRADMLAACVAAQTVSLISFLPMYLQVVRGAGTAHSGFLLLPLTLGVAMGSLLSGRTIAATGRTAIMPSIGLTVSACNCVLLAAFAPHLATGTITAMLALASFCTGDAMPVVQMTVQTVAGPQFLGAAAASVQFSRSVGAAFGTALVGAVLFALLAAQDPQTAGMFAALVEQGPHVLAALPDARRLLVQSEIADAFRGGVPDHRLLHHRGHAAGVVAARSSHLRTVALAPERRYRHYSAAERLTLINRNGGNYGVGAYHATACGRLRRVGPAGWCLGRCGDGAT